MPQTPIPTYPPSLSLLAATKGPRQHTCTRRPGYFQSKTAWISCAHNTLRVPSALPIHPTQKLPKARAPHKKNTLQSKYLDSVRPFSADNNPTGNQTKISQNHIYTKTVKDAILNIPQNRVLKEPAPPISPE